MSPLGMTIVAYAAHRHVGRTAILKWIKEGVITTEVDGTIDIHKADAAVDGAVGTRNPSLLQARVARECLKQEALELRLAKDKSKVIDKEKATEFIRTVIDVVTGSWLDWPARVAVEMAKELGVDPKVLLPVLTRHVKRHLSELPAIDIDL